MKRILITLALFCGPLAAAHSQAMPTATRKLDIQLGGGYVADFPDYTRHKYYGYGAYVDFDFSEHLGVEGEFRNATDPIIPGGERTYGVGLRYFRAYNRFNPYVKGMVGRAQLTYPPYPSPAPATSAGTLNYNYVAAGGGIDYALTWKIRLRADLEYQHWFASMTSPSPNDINGLPRGLTPIMYMGGLAYRFGGAPPLR